MASLLLVPQQQEEVQTYKNKKRRTPRSAVPGQIHTHSRKPRESKPYKPKDATVRTPGEVCTHATSECSAFSLSRRQQAMAEYLFQTFFASPSPAWSLFSCSVFICMPLMAKRLTFPWFLVFRLPFRLSICVPAMPFVGDDVST